MCQYTYWPASKIGTVVLFILSRKTNSNYNSNRRVEKVRRKIIRSFIGWQQIEINAKVWFGWHFRWMKNDHVNQCCSPFLFLFFFFLLAPHCDFLENVQFIRFKSPICIDTISTKKRDSFLSVSRRRKQTTKFRQMNIWHEMVVFLNKFHLARVHFAIETSEIRYSVIMIPNGKRNFISYPRRRTCQLPSKSRKCWHFVSMLLKSLCEFPVFVTCHNNLLRNWTTEPKAKNNKTHSKRNVSNGSRLIANLKDDISICDECQTSVGILLMM